MPEAASSVATWSTEQMMFKMVQVRTATGVTRMVWTAVVVRCGKEMEKLPHYCFSWIVFFQKQRLHICKMLPLETKKKSGDKEEDVRSYWMTLRTEEDTLIWRRKLWIAICGGIVLEEALNPSSDILLDDDDDDDDCHMISATNVATYCSC